MYRSACSRTIRQFYDVETISFVERGFMEINAEYKLISCVIEMFNYKQRSYIRYNNRNKKKALREFIIPLKKVTPSDSLETWYVVLSECMPNSLVVMRALDTNVLSYRRFVFEGNSPYFQEYCLYDFQTLISSRLPYGKLLLKTSSVFN